jgi:hypothetical protein
MAAANTKQSSYAHMATLTRMPTAAPWRYMTVWQTGQSLEGTKGQHLRSSFSDDGTTALRCPTSEDNVANRDARVRRGATETRP